MGHEYDYSNCGYAPIEHLQYAYRRCWLLSACAYKNKQQGNMRLRKNMRLTVLNRKGLDIEGGAIECVRAFRILKVSRSWKSTLWRALFEDITSLRLIQRKLAVEPLPLARTLLPQ